MIRNTESKLPFDVEPKFLGEAESAKDGKGYHLVSYLASPISKGTTNDYVLFGVSGAEAPDKYTWKMEIDDDEDPALLVGGETDYGCWRATIPANTKGKKIRVKCKMSFRDAWMEDVELTLKQKVRSGWKALDMLCDGAPPSTFAFEADTARELIENFSTYIEKAALSGKLTLKKEEKEVKGDSGSEGSAKKQDADKLIPPALLASFVYRAATVRPHAYERLAPASIMTLREDANERVARDLNSDNWAERAKQAYDSKAGVCGLGMSALLLLYEELAEQSLEKGFADFANETASLSEEEKYRYIYKKMLEETENRSDIDIFNLLRFPKTNIQLCAMMLNGIKNRDEKTTVANMKGKELLLDEASMKWLAEASLKHPVALINDSANPVKTGAYADSIWNLSKSPIIQSFFTVSHNSYELPYEAGETIEVAQENHADALGRLLRNESDEFACYNITAMQADLHRFGVFDSSLINGFFGKETTEAVTAFQVEIINKDANEFNSGIVNAITAEKLRDCVKKETTSKKTG